MWRIPAVLTLLLTGASRGVGRRKRELGLRKALGAQARQLLTMVLRDSSRPVIAGMLVGGVLSWWIAGAARTQIAAILFDVGLNDLPVIAGTALVIVLSAGMATLAPALRAAAVDPITALREE